MKDSCLKHMLPICPIVPFITLLADVSLTNPLSLSPAAPVNMSGSSSSTLQEQLDKLNDIAFTELCKGDKRNKGLVQDVQRQLKFLEAQISRQTSGKAQHCGSVLCCTLSLASGSTCLISMHTHAIVRRASWKPEPIGEVCSPMLWSACSVWLFAVVCECKDRSCSAGGYGVQGYYGIHVMGST